MPLFSLWFKSLYLGMNLRELSALMIFSNCLSISLSEPSTCGKSAKHAIIVLKERTYLSAKSQISLKGATFPSMEKTPSVAINFTGESFSANLDSKSGTKEKMKEGINVWP